MVSDLHIGTKMTKSAITSERPAIQTALTVSVKYVKNWSQVMPLIIKHNGLVSEVPFVEDIPEKKSLFFWKNLFLPRHRRDIYNEEKLGEQL